MGKVPNITKKPAAPVFRTLGTKSARADLRGVQPKGEWDLDGTDSFPPAYQLEPEGPDVTPSRVYEGVDPASKEREKQRAEKMELAIEKSKKNGKYQKEMAAIDADRQKRDATRRSIGAQADNFSEAMSRAQKALEMRTKNAPPDDKLTGAATPMPAAEEIQLPKQQSGGLVPQVVERDTRQRAREQFNEAASAYEKRGAKANAGKSFKDSLEEEIAANPSSPIGRYLEEYNSTPEGQADIKNFFSESRMRSYNDSTAENAKRIDMQSAEKERRETMRQVATQGPAMVLQLTNDANQAFQAAATKQQSGRATPMDFLAAHSASNRVAGAYAALHHLYPDRGFDAMYRAQLVHGNGLASMASELQANAQTNESTQAISAANNQQPPEKSTEEELRPMAGGPAAGLQKANAAARIAGPNADPAATKAALKTVDAAVSGQRAADIVATLGSGRGGITETELLQVAEFAKSAGSYEQFATTLMPSVKVGTPQQKQAIIADLWKRTRPLKMGMGTALKNAWNSLPSFSDEQR